MNAKPILLVSVVLNAALIVTVATLIKRAPAEPASSAPAAASPEAKAVAELRKPRPAVTHVVTNVAADKFDWRRVESDDYKEYIRNLRSIGCPEETIRDIIVADVKKLFEARRKESAASTNRFEYWKPGNPFGDLFSEEKLAQRKQLADEKKALLKELLGVEITDTADLMAGMNPYEAILDFLPAEKQTAIMEAQQKYAGKMMKAAKELQNNPKAMLALQKELDAELAELLGPADKEQFDLRLSQSAMMLRMRMNDFEPSEDEFRRMFAAQKKFDDEFGPYGNLAGTPEEREKRAAAEAQLKQEMKTALGDDRYRLYQYDQQWTRSSLKNVAEEYKVPREQAFRVFDLQETAQETAQKVRTDPSLAPAQREAALDAIRAQTEQAVAATIGADAAKAYVEKGSWIKNLNRRPNPAPAGRAAP